MDNTRGEFHLLIHFGDIASTEQVTSRYHVSNFTSFSDFFKVVTFQDKVFDVKAISTASGEKSRFLLSFDKVPINKENMS